MPHYGHRVPHAPGLWVGGGLSDQHLIGCRKPIPELPIFLWAGCIGEVGGKDVTRSIS